MTFKLDFGNFCAIKELELAHDELISKWGDRMPSDNDRLVNELNQTVNLLAFRVRCMCHDIRCRWWDNGRCRCDGEVGCSFIGFETRPELRSPDEPNATEIEKAKAEVPPEELARRAGEFFIVWKVRVADMIYRRAENLHNLPEDGTLSYRYDTWREENLPTRATNFEHTIHEVRSIGSDHTGDVTQAVGCLACGRVFQNVDYLNAHVDLRRFRGEDSHSMTYAVGPTNCDTIRPTASNYQPPAPRPNSIPEPRHERERGPDRIDGVRRGDHESIFDFIDDIRESIRTIIDEPDTAFPEATGCSNCGNIYEDERTYMRHAETVHGYSRELAEEHQVNDNQ